MLHTSPRREESRVAQEQQDGQQQQSRWRPTRRQLLWAGGVAVLAFLIIVICGYLFGWKWTGLPERTLWDWLDLLIVPVVLAIGGYLFTQTENQRASQDTAEQHRVDQKVRTPMRVLNSSCIHRRLSLWCRCQTRETRILRGSRTNLVLGALGGRRGGGGRGGYCGLSGCW